MKTPIYLTVAAMCLSGALFAQKMDGTIKPKIVTAQPAPGEFFFSNKATKPDKLDREAPIVITQFNVTLPQDQEFYARTGSGKLDSRTDAQVLVKFHISNLDKGRFQKATNDLADYFKERLIAQGFKIENYEAFSSGKKYKDMELKPAPKGEKPELFGLGMTVPGEMKEAKEAIMFSAYEQPLYPSQAMKVAYIAMEKKINPLTFGWVLNFMELESRSSISNTTNSISISYNAQLYGDPWIIASSHNMKGSIWIQPNTTERPKEAIYGYSFGREFATQINKETGDVQIDNDKFIAAYLELGKSYIDNMTALMAPSK